MKQLLTSAIADCVASACFYLKFAALGITGQEGALFFGGFFHQKLGSALGALFIYRFVPDGKGAIRKAAATVKNFTPLGCSLNKVSAAIRFRAVDPDFFSAVV